jgi:hypothetical protein
MQQVAVVIDLSTIEGEFKMDKKTILVIDDTPSNLILLSNLLC